MWAKIKNYVGIFVYAIGIENSPRRLVCIQLYTHLALFNVDFENWEYYHVAKLFKYDFNISRVIKLNEISGSELLGYTKKDICDKFELNDASLATFLNIHTLLCNKIYQPDHANASINIEGTKKVGSNELGENISRVESISTVDSLNNDYEHFAHDNSTAHIDILNPGNKGKSIFEESNLVESLFSQHDSYDSKKSTNVLSKLAKNVTIISKTSNDKDSTRISQSCNSIVDKRHVQRIDDVAIVKGTISNNFKTDCPVSFDNNKNAVQISSDVAHSSNSIVEQKTNNSKPNMKDSMLKIDKIESKPRRTSTRVVCNNNNMQQISATQLDFKKLSAKSDKKTVPSAKNARKQKETGLVKYAFKHKKLSNIKKSKSNRSLHNNVDIPCLSYTGPREGNIIHDIQFASVSYKKGSKYFDFIPWPTNKCNITHLIVSKLQTKPTLKILYALANKSYILTPNYVYYAIQNGNWPAEEDCEHPEWPKLKERNNVKLPFKGSKFYLVSNLKKISISDAATIVSKLNYLDSKAWR